MNQNSSSSIDSETNQQLFDEDKYLTTIFDTLDSFLRGCNLMLVNLHQSKTPLNIFSIQSINPIGYGSNITYSIFESNSEKCSLLDKSERYLFLSKYL